MRARRTGAVMLPIALALVALAGALVAARRPSAPAAPGIRPVLAPVLSVRRVPAVLTTALADVRLTRRLDAILERPALGSARQNSCLVVRQGSRSVYSRRESRRLVPASNVKILTAMAALAELGGDTTFTTEVKTAVPPRDGVVDGPLYLVGGGDPLLATADYAATIVNAPQPVTAMETLADRVRDAGVREVRGPVLGDESRYDAERYLSVWRASYITDSQVGPLSALTVNDGFSRWRPNIAAAAPAANAASVFANLLRARGIAVGGAGEGRVPSGTSVLASLSSLPVGEVVAEMLRESDNLTAELLVKELGRREGGEGSTAAGLAVVKAALTEAGLPAGDADLDDGSGLARTDRATCRLLIGAVVAPPTRVALEAGMPVAARTGTLAPPRFAGHPAAGKVRAKTGSLDHVTGLSGWAKPSRGPDLAFALLANDLPDRLASGRTLQEAVAAALVAYPDAPDPDRIGPGA